MSISACSLSLSLANHTCQLVSSKYTAHRSQLQRYHWSPNFPDTFDVVKRIMNYYQIFASSI